MHATRLVPSKHRCATGELGRNPAKQRALELQEAIRNLQQQRAELAAEEERAKASPEEQREALMAKVSLALP
jgi:hypothetical protein